MRYVLPRVVETLARSQELLLLFAIAWGTSLAALGEVMGFSKEAGAFLAGFSLASTAYRDAIGARLTSLRDFLLLFFFLDLGSKLDFSTLGGEVVPSLVLALFVLIGNPLIVLAIMGYMGYRKRTGFLAGLTVAQISEFSIIFVAMGIGLGHIGPDALGLTTLVGLVTITLSTYMILYSQQLFDVVGKWLGPFERKRPFRELRVERRRHRLEEPEAVIIGLGRYGSRLAERLRDRGIRVLGVDFDPEAVRAMRKRGVPVMFGDGEAPDFIDTLPLDHARWVVSTVREEQANRSLLSSLAERNFRGHIAVVSPDVGPDAADSLGPRIRLLYPFRDAADYAALDLAARIVSEQHADEAPEGTPAAAGSAPAAAAAAPAAPSPPATPSTPAPPPATRPRGA
jgi:voltage-gated potassium channel Kch